MKRKSEHTVEIVDDSWTFRGGNPATARMRELERLYHARYREHYSSGNNSKQQLREWASRLRSTDKILDLMHERMMMQGRAARPAPTGEQTKRFNALYDEQLKRAQQGPAQPLAGRKDLPEPKQAKAPKLKRKVTRDEAAQQLAQWMATRRLK